VRTIIAGSRSATAAQVQAAMATCPWVDQITLVVSGTAPGADQAGEQWAEAHNLPVERYPADWTAHGRAAGPIRNRHMAGLADALVAVWDEQSPGTKSMIGYAGTRGLRIWLYKTKLGIGVDASPGNRSRASA